MIADYAFGWATLTWWTYLILAAVVVLSTWIASRVAEREVDDRTQPCMEYMGEVLGDHGFRPAWCFLVDGHEGDHRDHEGMTVVDRLYDRTEKQH